MRTHWTAQLGMVVAGLGAGLLLSELILRLLGIIHPIFYRADYYLGQSGRPGVEGWWIEEGEAYVRFNSGGFRDLEHAEQKPKGVFRIAVLGDSYADALQVPIQDTFWKVMEQYLGRRTQFTSRKVEVMNFGVSGYGTAQEVIMLRRYVWAYSPDLVICLVTTGNDIRDNSASLDLTKMRPFFEFKDGRLVLDNSFRTVPRFRFSSSLLWRALCRVSDYSRTAQLAYDLMVVAHRTRQAQVTAPHGEELGLDAMVFREPSDPAWKDAWRVTDTLLEMLHDETKAGGVQLLVVTGTSGIQVDPDPATGRAFAKRLDVPDLFYPDRRIAALGERKDFAVLNLAEPLQVYAQQHHVYLHGFKNTKMGGGHWNAEGHRIAGQLIARKVCEMRF